MLSIPQRCRAVNVPGAWANGIRNDVPAPAILFYVPEFGNSNNYIGFLFHAVILFSEDDSRTHDLPLTKGFLGRPSFRCLL